MHKTVSECLVCGIGARVVPLRARLRPGWPPLGSFGIFGTSHNNLHQDCVTNQLRFQWFCCIGCKRPRWVHTMVLTFECKVRRYLTDLLNCSSNTFQLISLFENRRHAKPSWSTVTLYSIYGSALCWLPSVDWLIRTLTDANASLILPSLCASCVAVSRDYSKETCLPEVERLRKGRKLFLARLKPASNSQSAESTDI